jgi:hypothetical protein
MASTAAYIHAPVELESWEKVSVEVRLQDAPVLKLIVGDSEVFLFTATWDNAVALANSMATALMVLDDMIDTELGGK